MKTKEQIQTEIDTIQRLRHIFERDYHWRSNHYYYVKGLRWVLEDSEFMEKDER